MFPEGWVEDVGDDEMKGEKVGAMGGDSGIGGLVKYE